MEKERYIFQPLIPRNMDKDDKYTVYKNALDSSYLNEEIKNIAITGPYGAGKSSFWKTYKEEKIGEGIRRAHDIITVALSDFNKAPNLSEHVLEGEEVISNSSTTKDVDLNSINTNEIERQIINQILYQIDIKKISLSKYEIKKKPNKGEKYINIFMVFLFCIGIALIFLKSDIINILDDGFKKLASFQIGLTILLTSMISLIYLFCKFFRKFINKLRKVSIKGNEIDLTEKSDRDVFNEEIRELVYLITAGDIKTIVFEDLDRYKNVDLFTKLRELNYLVNSVSDFSIRFIYMIGDDLFLRNDRTKFFDIIIPIVPIINTQNSKGKLLELFQPLKSESKPDDKILEKMSLFIDDMRLLYSIRNEYEVYSEAIDIKKRDLDPNKLFGIIVFKNIFPQEFDIFQKNKGYVFNIFNKIENERESRRIELETRIMKAKEKVTELKLNIVNNKYEIMALHIPSNLRIRNLNSVPWSISLKEWQKEEEKNYFIDSEYFSGSLNFNQFIDKVLLNNEKYLEASQILLDNNDKKELIDYLTKDISKMSREMDELNITNISTLLKQYPSTEVTNFFEEEQNDPIFKNQHFPLIKFLLIEGLLDETYSNYLGYFYESKLGINDEIFMRKLLDGSASDEHFILDNPEEVKVRLEDKDYDRKGIYNHSLVLEVIKDKEEKKFWRIIRTTLSNELKIDSLLKFLDELSLDDISLASFLIIKENFDTYLELISKVEVGSSLHYKLIINAYVNYNIIENQGDYILSLKEYTIGIPNILKQKEIFNESAFLDNLKKANFKFKDISQTNLEAIVASDVENKELFEVNVPNVLHLLIIIESINDEDAFSLMLKYLYEDKKFSITKSRVDREIEVFLTEYIEYANNHSLKSSSGFDTFKEILDSKIPYELKVKFIEIETTIVEKLNEIEYDPAWPYLLKNKLVAYMHINILTYHSVYGTDENLISYLNEFSTSSQKLKTLPLELADEIVGNEKINSHVFNLAIRDSEIILENINKSLLTNDKLGRVKRLIDNSRVALTLPNFILIQSTYNNDLLLNLMVQNNENLIDFLLDNYDEIVDVQTVIQLILENNIVNNDQSKTLIDRFNKPISLYDIPHANIDIRLYILLNNFDKVDIEEINNDAEHFDLLNEYMEMMDSDNELFSDVLELNLTDEFSDLFIMNKNVDEDKRNIFLINLIKQRKFPERWPAWIESFESEDFKKLGTIFHSKRPDYPAKSSLAKELADELINIGIISKSDLNKLYYRENEYKALL